jgi:hypothetical protein
MITVTPSHHTCTGCGTKGAVRLLQLIRAFLGLQNTTGTSMVGMWAFTEMPPRQTRRQLWQFPRVISELEHIGERENDPELIGLLLDEVSTYKN